MVLFVSTIRPILGIEQKIISMANLPRFTLSYDQSNEDWVLKRDATGQTVRRYNTKAEATEGGVLEAAVGSAGGSVRIEKVHGGYQEERTYPRSRDPRRSPG
jgi:Uncharacterized protein conserved in bacteria (DUF2188)